MMTPHEWKEHIRRAAEDADCDHGAFMCSDCFYKMVQRCFTEAIDTARWAHFCTMIGAVTVYELIKQRTGIDWVSILQMSEENRKRAEAAERAMAQMAAHDSDGNEYAHVVTLKRQVAELEAFKERHRNRMCRCTDCQTATAQPAAAIHNNSNFDPECSTCAAPPSTADGVKQ